MNILVVDDSKVMRHMIVKILNELGYHAIFEASDVPEAKRVLSQETIALILSDWNMPEESGLDFLKYVRASQEFAKIPFVLITTEQDKKNIFDAVKSGAQSYMVKPVKKDVFTQKLIDLVVSHGIQAPLLESVVKSSSEENAGQKCITVTSQLDFDKKMEFAQDEKRYMLFPADISEGELPEELKNALPNLKLALLSDAIDIDTIKALQTKNRFRFILEF